MNAIVSFPSTRFVCSKEEQEREHVYRWLAASLQFALLSSLEIISCSFVFLSRLSVWHAFILHPYRLCWNTFARAPFTATSRRRDPRSSSRHERSAAWAHDCGRRVLNEEGKSGFQPTEKKKKIWNTAEVEYRESSCRRRGRTRYSRTWEWE